MLENADGYDNLLSGFRWDLPQRFNIAEAVSTRWARADPGRVCLLHFNPNGPPDRLTWAELEERANRLANGLRRLGTRRGDRVAILMPQSFETVIAHVAIYKLAAIAVPLALLFGEDALGYRLAACGARAIITTPAGRAKIARLPQALPELESVVVAPRPEEEDGAVGFDDLIARSDGSPVCEETELHTPAMMIFTSGTTGPPKGAVHGHRVLLGHLPGVQMPHEFLPQPGDRLWTPADWAWAGGLLNVLLPGLYFGIPVVSTPAQKFDPEMAYRIMAELKVRNAFIPPTALRLMRSVSEPLKRYRLDLRTLASGGEALGRETYDWGQRVLGLTINEFYGQTECNLVLASCSSLGVSRGGAIGKAVPGHTVAVVDGAGRPLEPGVPGQIAVKRPDPVMFLEYWNDPAATVAKFIGDWMMTGDQGVMDADGYISFFGREDDVITSSGYRIGPGEVEDCLLGHEAVRIAAVIGKPDPVRTEIVKAYVVLNDGFEPGEALERTIVDWVRTRLSAHEYPREVAFVESLPLTTTGKVIRRQLRDLAAGESQELDPDFG